MDYKYFIGIDISKAVLDICLVSLPVEGSKTHYYQCENSTNSITDMFANLFLEHSLNPGQVLMCAEHTGHYGNKLVEVVIKKGYQLWLENPSQIKLSQGMFRGKDDKKDAAKIAFYAFRFSDKALIFKCNDVIFDKLTYLCNERDLLVADRAKYKAQLKDAKGFVEQDYLQQKHGRIGQLIAGFDQIIQQIETDIDELISHNDQLKLQYEILLSVDGIGPQVAIQTIIATQGFSKFTDARKFACHAGCAPFKYHSGSSIRSRNKVSHRADKNLKRLFHMAALSVVNMKGELRDYFVRKVGEGKNKMSVINAIRSKLIARIFALIKKKKKYQKNYLHPLTNP